MAQGKPRTQLREQVLPALVRALDDSDAEVRGAAADALGAIGKVRERVQRAVLQIRRS